MTDIGVHDDPVGRTRFAWVRTVLGVLAVTALVERGLLMSGVDAWVLAVALLPGAAFSVAAYARMRVVSADASRGAGDRVVVPATAALVGLALVGLASAALLGR
jgi:hypothetical protein